MSHEPPIPEAARSPYPLQQPPIAARDEADATPEGEALDREAKARSEGNEQSWTDRARDTLDRATESKVALGAAVGIGSAALLAALLFSRRGNGRSGGTGTANATPMGAKKPTRT